MNSIKSMSESEEASRDGAIASEVLALENRRWQIIIQNDIEAYEKLLAEGLVYIHSTGRIDDKESFLASRLTSKKRFVSFEPSDLCVRVYNLSTAIVTGRIRNVQRLDGEKVVHNSFTSVWIRPSNHSGDWRFASYHQSRIASAHE